MKKLKKPLVKPLIKPLIKPLVKPLAAALLLLCAWQAQGQETPESASLTGFPMHELMAKPLASATGNNYIGGPTSGPTKRTSPQKPKGSDYWRHFAAVGVGLAMPGSLHYKYAFVSDDDVVVMAGVGLGAYASPVLSIWGKPIPAETDSLERLPYGLGIPTTISVGVRQKDHLVIAVELGMVNGLVLDAGVLGQPGGRRLGTDFSWVACPVAQVGYRWEPQLVGFHAEIHAGYPEFVGASLGISF